MTPEQHQQIITAYIYSQFGYRSLVWMFTIEH